MSANIEFHTGVQDPLGFTVRLLKKAYRSGARVRVTAPASILQVLDRQLWTDEERDFVPHAQVAQMSAAMAALPPLWLAPDAQALPAGASAEQAPLVLVNLGAEAPVDVHHWQRLIEVVGIEVDEVERGRARWAHYKKAGRGIEHLPAGRARA
jgi:DNA polymerase III subunit chi